MSVLKGHGMQTHQRIPINPINPAEPFAHFVQAQSMVYHQVIQKLQQDRKEPHDLQHPI